MVKEREINDDTFLGKNIKKRRNYILFLTKKKSQYFEINTNIGQHRSLIPCSLPIHSHHHACFNQVT